MKEVKPYKHSSSGKSEQVEMMFDNIAKRYDFLNHLLSLGIDKMWRKKAIQLLTYDKPKSVLDIATGTADFAIAALKLKPERIVGVDISEKMLNIGRKKILKLELENKISLLKCSSEKLPFNDNTFEAATVAFGVRNFENLNQGLKEIYRVLMPDGNIVVLEFAHPKTFPVKQLYTFYSKTILPLAGRLISKDKAAYTYLPASIDKFPSGHKFLEELSKAGFKDTFYKKLSFGIVNIYKAKK